MEVRVLVLMGIGVGLAEGGTGTHESLSVPNVVMGTGRWACSMAR